MKPKLSIIFLLPIGAAFALPIFADTITDYTITFTTTFGSPAPTSGSFTYDSTNPAFSNFLVQWDGITFDETASANAPQVGGTGCSGESSTPEYTFTILTKTASGCNQPITYLWSAQGLIVTNHFSMYLTDNIAVDGIVALAPNLNSNQDSALGEWSVAPAAGQVPEPRAISLLLFGMVGLSLLVQSKSVQRSQLR